MTDFSTNFGDSDLAGSGSLQMDGGRPRLEADLILMTEKDAVKCRQLAGLRDDQRIWVVPVAAQIDAEFGSQLLAKLSEIKHGRTSA